MEKLISKLGSGEGTTEEDNLNGCSILCDMLETKEFYTLVSKKSNI